MGPETPRWPLHHVVNVLPYTEPSPTDPSREIPEETETSPSGKKLLPKSGTPSGLLHVPVPGAVRVTSNRSRWGQSAQQPLTRSIFIQHLGGPECGAVCSGSIHILGGGDPSTHCCGGTVLPWGCGYNI